MNLTIGNLDVINKAVNSRLDKMIPVFRNALGVEKARIQQRTQQGVDVDGNKFRAYRPRTVKERTRRGLKTDPVDLTFTGAMFRAFKLSFTKGQSAVTGILSFGQEAYKVISNAEYGRDFFGLNKSQIDIIKDKLRQVK